MSGRGLFITLEGGEGVGKSTALAHVASRLGDAGVPLVTTREPGGSALAEDIREVLLAVREEPVDDLAELLLMFAARAQHLARRIRPALEAGQWVLCDRFTDATYAYQSGGRELPARWVQQLETLVQGELRPDCTLLLDAPVTLGIERARGRGDLDRFEREQVAFFERVRATYLRLARESSGRYRVIDAGQPLSAVRAQLDVICSELLACENGDRQ
ncbi:dTMP kinase [Pseudohaliea rubra]|uniref:Thymidylate kinase n=1 Tax=Pseudohaliea rubra DSM 19751 TaxID=1265313 RepID=A0A095WYA1_9GAMM|nr:dTMP kinase [Pseudohaliea rubra]KGE03579.1 Thymidylate kinase [Pseudohaliea rubra DSM 19751]